MRVAAAVALCALLASGPARANLFADHWLFGEPPAAVPRELGSVLYHFFQDDARAALVASLYVEARAGGPLPRRDDILLARASAALSLGMVEPARRALDGVDVAALPADAAARLDLALARVAFLDGEDATAQLHLARLPEAMRSVPAVAFLDFELARRRGDVPAMQVALAALPDRHRLWYFAQHNFGVAAHDAGDTGLALAAFERLAGTPAFDDGQFDVTLRAGLQAAFLVIERGDLDGAATRLEAMPASGTYGRAALATHARVSLSREAWGRAAQVYALLGADAATWDPHRLAALLGEPFALERSAGAEAALAGYRNAADALAARSAALDALAARLAQDADIATRMADLPFADGDGLRAQLQALDAAFAGIDWVSWLASAQTQRYLAAFRQLRELGARIARLEAQADALGDAAAEQERRVARAASRLDADGLAAGLRSTEARLAELTAQLRALRVAPADVAARGAYRAALATGDERTLLATLSAMRERAAAAGRQDLVQRAQRLAGRVTFGIEADAAARRWQIEKQVQARSAQLAGLLDRVARIRAAEQERRARAGAVARVAGYRGALDALGAQVHQLAAERGSSLLASLAEQVGRDRAETASHLAYARLAVARLHDSLMMARAGAAP